VKIFEFWQKIDQNSFGIEIYQFIHISKSLTLSVPIPHGPSPDLKKSLKSTFASKIRVLRIVSKIHHHVFLYIFTFFINFHNFYEIT